MNYTDFDLSIFYHSFTAGTYPQWNGEELIEVTVTPEDLQQIAAEYDPSFRKAPLWIGHPGTAPALGWIGEVKADGKKLLVRYDFLNEKGIQLLVNKEYLFVSAEISIVKKNGRQVLYLRANGLTNTPLVDSLEELRLLENSAHTKKGTIFCSCTDDDTLLLAASGTGIQTPVKTNHNKMPLSPDVLKFAERMRISINDYNSDQAVLEHAAGIIDKLKAKFADDPEAVGSLDLCIAKYEQMPAKVSDLEKRLLQFETNKAEMLVQAAIDGGKIVPSQKDVYVIAASQDYDKVKKQLEELPKNPLFEKNLILASGENPKGGQSINASQGAGAAKVDPKDKDTWDYDTWSKKDPAGLKKLKAESPEKFGLLFENQYGVKFEG